MGKILVIIPVYNCDFILRDSIESVLSQSYENFVLSIIDDNSQDNTYKIIQEYKEKDKRIIIYKLNENKGTYYARNIALQNHIKDFQYWVIQGADDIMHREKLEEQIKVLNGKSLASICNYDRINYYTKELLRTSIMSDCILFKKEVFDKIGYYDWTTRFAGDSEYLLRFYEKFGTKALLKIDKVLYTAYIHDNNLTLKIPYKDKLRMEYKERYNNRLKVKDKISHMIVSRMLFGDKNLLKKYLEITKKILIPCLKSQVNKNFTWAVLIYEEDVEFVREYLEIEFKPFFRAKDLFNYLIENKVNIQTRHDIDDFMSDTYIERIQQVYKENITKWDSFLVQSQPIKLLYREKKELKMWKYTEKRNSMFLSLCQKNATHHIFEKVHSRMHEIAPNVITLPEGYTKWVIHGNNISIIGRK